MIRYFKAQKGIVGLELVEQSHNQNYHIKIVPMDGVFVIHMMDNNPYPSVEQIVKFVEEYKPRKLIIDFTSVETYIENKIIEEYNTYHVDKKIW